MLCKRFNHVAYRCSNARATADFYTEVLGLRLAHVVGGDHVPSTGEHHPHIHLFFELEDGTSIAFFEVPQAPGGVRDDTMPDWIQHVAFEVADVETLMAKRADFEAKGIAVLGPTNHGFLLSIYLHDPSGHRVELTCRTATLGDPATVARSAWELLAIWDRTHDWSALGAEDTRIHA